VDTPRRPQGQADRRRHATRLPLGPGLPWPRFTGRTFSDLYALPGPALHLPRYPLYTPDEPRRGDFDYFFLRGPRYASCQAARFMLLGGEFLTLADAAGVDLTTDLSDYWNGYFREHFLGQFGPVIRYAGATGYRQRAAEFPRHRIVSPHPFDSAHLPAERYYLADPHLVVRLNDKGRIAELTPHVLRHETLDAQAFADGQWRERWELPFVLKLTEPSGGGDGVVLCRRETQVREAQHRLRGRPVKVEPLIESIRHNYNVQLQVTRRGHIRYIGGSVQRVAAGRYAGNLIDLAWLPPAPVARICDQVARAAAALGWYGVCGLDLLEDGAGAVWFIDPNFRLNGSTPFFLLGDYLATRHRRPQLTTGYFCFPGTPTELLDHFRQEIHRRELIPVGACYDPRADGITRLYAAVASDGDPQTHAGLLASFESKHLVAGIAL
jgi:hypothetical protein